jgi:hypothetical protein
VTGRVGFVNSALGAGFGRGGEEGPPKRKAREKCGTLMATSAENLVRLRALKSHPNVAKDATLGWGTRRYVEDRAPLLVVQTCLGESEGSVRAASVILTPFGTIAQRRRHVEFEGISVRDLRDN